jgi:hypothetical protein
MLVLKSATDPPQLSALPPNAKSADASEHFSCDRFSYRQ